MPLQILNKSTSWPKIKNSFLRLSNDLMILNFKKPIWINYWKTLANRSNPRLTVLYYLLPAPIPMTLQRSLAKRNPKPQSPFQNYILKSKPSNPNCKPSNRPNRKTLPYYNTFCPKLKASLIQKIKPLNLMHYHIHLQVLSIFQMIF